MKERKKTKKTLQSELDEATQRYTRAIYSIMEFRHALGDTEAKWSHDEVVAKIKELMKESNGGELESTTPSE